MLLRRVICSRSAIASVRRVKSGTRAREAEVMRRAAPGEIIRSNGVVLRFSACLQRLYVSEPKLKIQHVLSETTTEEIKHI